jgi:uncharacterized protein (DUF885 family)
MVESPTRASALGIDGHDTELGDFSAAGFERRAQEDETWLGRLQAVADADLTLDDTIDRDLVISSLKGRIAMRDWAVWKRDPATYLGPGLSGVFTLFLNRIHPEPDLARFAAARLSKIPGVLAEGKANLEAELASPIFVERALGQCRAGASYARDLVPAEVADDALRSQVAEAGAAAADAFDDFASFLTELKEKAAGPYAIGEARYSALLTEKECLGYGAEEMREKGRAAYAELDAEMKELAQRIDGADDWHAVILKLNQEHAATPEDMRAEYERWTQDARQFLIDHNLVTLPEGERCLVEPSPPFQRPVLAVASYSSPPAFRPSLTGHFFVPFPPEGASADDIQKRLETNSHWSIPTIAVHEAYPGHHWHLSWSQGNDRAVRKVIGTSYFSEGWALYAERLMREHGFFDDPRYELCHLDARIFRAARIVVDTSLHIGDMTFEEAVTFMGTKASLSAPTARAEVGRYCSWPTQASSYLTGCIEIERIRSQYLAAGKGDVHAFNDALAGSGMLPIALAERAVLG